MQTSEKEMKQHLKMTTAFAAALFALAFVAITMPSANAEDFCRTDSSGMRGCGFASLQLCKDMASGRGGTCAPNPFPAQASIGNAYASMRQTHPKRALHHHAK